MDGRRVILSRTGYTGEDGFEVYASPELTVKFWDRLLAAGVKPCALGCRDTLRFEAGLPLYGDELSAEISPVMAGLGMFCKLDKEEFIGKDALVAAGAPKRVRVGLGVTGRGIVREHQDVFIGDEKIGVTTSGTHCPYLGKAIAMALVDANHAEVGTAVEVEVRGRRVACEIIPLPFYTRGK